jgi:hypothetical protein
MTEIEDQYNWNKLAERGDSYEQIRTELNALEVSWYGLHKEKVFTEENEFTKDFKQEIKTKVDKIFESSTLPKKDITSIKRKFHARVRENLELVVIKKGYAQITFDQHPLYKFFEAFNNFVNEVEFSVSKDHIKIVISDPSRIAVIKVVFSNDTYSFFREGTLGINIEDLKDLLKCNAKDESSITLLFTEGELEMKITSPKRKRAITRKQFAIDFALQEMPINTLNAIKYPFEFDLTKEDYLDLMSNSGRYSEIVGIKTTPDQVIFSESSDKGSGELDYKKDDLPRLNFLKEMLLLDSELENERIADKEILLNKQCVGYYSLTFLKLIKEFCNVVATKDKIAFWLKSSHPLKVEIVFKKLSNAHLVYYLAPRKDEVEDDDDDFEPTETEEEDFVDDFEPTDNEED